MKSLAQLIIALRCLPGVGEKSAQRMAFHLLQRDRAGAQQLAIALQEACSHTLYCSRCHTFSDTPICVTCEDASRDSAQLCVVETPADQSVMERTSAYKGLYFVLLGRISPLDGVSPQSLGLKALFERATDGVVREVILATSFTAEGEATAHLIAQALKSRGLQVTRLARGIPAGSELEYVDLGTIAYALGDRK